MGTPALHPDAEKLLQLIRATGRPPFETLSVAEAREAYAASRAALHPPPDEVAEVRDLPIPPVDDALPRTPKDPERLLALSERWGLESALNRFLAALEVAHSQD